MAKGNSLHLSSRSIFSHYYSSIFEIFSSHYENSHIILAVNGWLMEGFMHVHMIACTGVV